MARARKNSVRNLQYGPRTRLVRDIYNARAAIVLLVKPFVSKVSDVAVTVNVVVFLSSLQRQPARR